MKRKVKNAVRMLFHHFGYDLLSFKHLWGVRCWHDMRRLLGSASVQTVFDVGANVGQTALVLAREYREADVFAFEPVPSTYQQLLRNTKQVSSIRCFNIGLGTNTCHREITLYGNSEVSSLIPNAPFAVKFLKGKATGTARIELVTGDAFANEHGIGAIDLLKIDTEGFDLEVIRGCSGLLSENAIRFIYCEFNELTSVEDSCGGVLADIWAFLQPYNFRLVGLYTDYLWPNHNFLASRNVLFVNRPRYQASIA